MSFLRAQEVARKAIFPGLAHLDPYGVPGGHAATVFLMAVGLQESDLLMREQDGGSAVGFWQFEIAGVRGVLSHPRSGPIAGAVCSDLGCNTYAEAIYGRIRQDDVMAAIFARLLLWTDPMPIPVFGPVVPWQVYKRLWRPGRPRRERWDAAWRDANTAWREGLRDYHRESLLASLAGSGGMA